MFITLGVIKISVVLVYLTHLVTDKSNFRDVDYGTNYLPSAKTSSLQLIIFSLQSENYFPLEINANALCVIKFN